ncbi:MAG: hypothetical protein K2O91_00540 [Lachnospiraceae bacterium]|nr:hypothetical protein [Lachnospiraceae bacterium]
MGQNRKWEKVLLVVLLLSAVILAVLLAAQLDQIKQKDQKEPLEETQEESQTEESQTETAEEYASTEETENFEEGEWGYIIIGDSHIVVTEGMGYSVYGSCVEDVALNRNLFLVHTGLDPVMGTIEWLEGDGTERIEEIIAEHAEISQWNIISMHGTSMVTMPDITDRYIQNYHKWIDERFHDCHVYIVSVPPLDEKEWVVRHPDMPKRSNQDIVAFNTCIQEAFPDNYFDYYDWFLEHGDAFQDEIHYTGEIYCEIFDEIIKAIQQK